MLVTVRFSLSHRKSESYTAPHKLHADNCSSRLHPPLQTCSTVQLLTITPSHTVDREIFVVKIFFRQLLRWQKLNARKFLMRMFNFHHMATQQKLNAQTFLTRKKSYAKISRSMVVWLPNSYAYSIATVKLVLCFEMKKKFANG